MTDERPGPASSGGTPSSQPPVSTTPREPLASAEELPEETAAERRIRLARVFGDVLPDTTGDERDPHAGRSEPEEDPGDDWLRRQVPPHHG